MPASDDASYVQLLLTPLSECAKYRPAFGQNEDEGIDLPRFRTLYGSDPLYHWIGLDSELMYAAHKAAGGMTSIYRQLGIGCERLLRQVIQDCFVLSDEEAIWSYEYDKGDGKMGVHKLDVCVRVEQIKDKASRARFLAWVRSSATRIGVPQRRAAELTGAVFEVRQGYKSADSKRQNADLRFGLRAYADEDMLPVIAIVSTQASDVVCRRYQDARLVVLRGQLGGEASTFVFFRDVVGYDLAKFFERNTVRLRTEFESIIRQLLTP